MLGLQEAIQLAKDQQSSLRIIHVVDESFALRFPEVMSGSAGLIDALTKDGQRILDNTLALAAQHGVKADGVMCESATSPIAEVILNEAQKWPADIIVMGTHGRRGFDRVVLGSDAEAMLRTSPVPVLTVRSTNKKHGNTQ